jgi:hypothetical protein
VLLSNGIFRVYVYLVPSDTSIAQGRSRVKGSMSFRMSDLGQVVGVGSRCPLRGSTTRSTGYLCILLLLLYILIL